LAGLAQATIAGVDRPVLLGVFCTFHGNKIVLLFHGYDRSQARKLHDAWRRRQ